MESLGGFEGVDAVEVVVLGRPVQRIDSSINIFWRHLFNNWHISHKHRLSEGY